MSATGDSPPRGGGDEIVEKHLRSLLQVTRAINAHLSVDQQLPLIMDAAIELTGADRGFLVLKDDLGNLRVRASRTAKSERRADGGKYSRGVIEKVVVSGEAVFVLDTDLDLEIGQRASIQALAVRTVMCTPLSSQSGITGALYVDCRSPLRAFTERQSSIFSSLADHAAIALENARLYEMSVCDPMTGLYNHSYFVRRLSEELKAAQRDGHSVTVMMLDVDHFKAVNDRFGHRAGNEVLRKVANALVSSIRGVDIAVRYGGDEFAVIAPGTSGRPADGLPSTGAETMAERIRANVEALETTPKTSVSIGLASYPEDVAGDETALIEAADRALYEAKRAGRNCVARAKDF